jgi:non-ribosomal peptide synthetase component E (peptide arylation enzyme)
MRIVDDDGDPITDGSVGELLVRGVGVMAGYNKRERAETFDEDGWYHTGDRVYRKEGVATPSLEDVYLALGGRAAGLTR